MIGGIILSFRGKVHELILLALSFVFSFEHATSDITFFLLLLAHSFHPLLNHMHQLIYEAFLSNYYDLQSFLI